jgi:hypothetical protein
VAVRVHHEDAGGMGGDGRGAAERGRAAEGDRRAAHRRDGTVGVLPESQARLRNRPRRRLLPVTRPRRLLPVLCAALLAATGLAACGDSSSGSSIDGKDASAVLKETFGPDKPVKSGRLNLQLKFDGQGLQGLSGPIAAQLSGPFQSQGGKTLPKFDFDLNLNLSGQSLSAGAVSTGDKGYVSFAGQTFELGTLYDAFKRGYEQSVRQASKKSGGATFSTLGIDPLRWLTNPQKAGEEQVGGADTVHVTSDINVPKLLDDVSTLLGKAPSLGVTGAKGVPTSISPQTRRQIADAVKSAKLDVWSGKDDGILRRMTLDLSFAVPQSVQSKAGGLKGGSLTADLTIADLNKDQTITAPKNARPFSDLTSQLQGLFGGALGGSGSSGSGSGSGGGSGSSGATGKSSSKYLDCLQKAGTDITKVQACADLVGK